DEQLLPGLIGLGGEELEAERGAVLVEDVADVHGAACSRGGGRAVRAVEGGLCSKYRVLPRESWAGQRRRKKVPRPQLACVDGEGVRRSARRRYPFNHRPGVITLPCFAVKLPPQRSQGAWGAGLEPVSGRLGER